MIINITFIDSMKALNLKNESINSDYLNINRFVALGPVINMEYINRLNIFYPNEVNDPSSLISLGEVVIGQFIFYFVI
ncbi:MAG: hypothetical protein ACFE8N_13360, partial [Promethearchaeota archaeon]